MKKTLLLCAAFVFLFARVSFGQLIFEENFAYTAGDVLTSHGWTVSSGGGTNPLTVTSNGLTFPNYASVSGNSLPLTTSGEDDYKSFTAASSGSVYLSFMMKVSGAKTGDYFLGLSPSTTQTNYYMRIHLKSTTNGYLIGLSKNNEKSGGNVYGTTVLKFDTTYVVVAKHTFSTTSTTDDAETIYVFNNALPATEPSTAEILNYTAGTITDPTDLGYITIRQGSSSSAPTLVLDGIRIASSWAGGGVGIEKTEGKLPTTFQLNQNYPNPFNPSTTISYAIPENSNVVVRIFDILGREIQAFKFEGQSAGSHSFKWNGLDKSGAQIASGNYIYNVQVTSLQTGSVMQKTAKMTFLK